MNSDVLLVFEMSRTSIFFSHTINFVDNMTTWLVIPIRSEESQKLLLPQSLRFFAPLLMTKKLPNQQFNILHNFFACTGIIINIILCNFSKLIPFIFIGNKFFQPSCEINFTFNNCKCI